jgi:DNA-binding transcriptional LysR family regulator
MGDPRVSDFLALLEVAKTNSFSSAAKDLQTNPVNLLNRINKLEGYFQTKIFTRTNRGVFLTKDGEKIVEIARAVVGLLSSTRPSEAPTPERTIRIGGSMIAGEYMLPCVISNYKMANPNMKFDLEILKPHAMLEKLKKGELDLISYIKQHGEPRPDEVEIAKDRLVVIAPPKHELLGRERLKLGEILRYPLILYEPDHELAEIVEDFLISNGVKAKSLEVKMLLPDPTSVIASVSEGLGLSLCSEIIAKKAERARLVGIVNPEGATGGRYSIYIKRQGEPMDEALNSFWGYIEKMSERFEGNLPCMLKMLYL